ncbi:MAG: hypothetical protein ACD_78C00393G0003 [uncultured bacterium (gcode 4)]|uniref:Uncharacterized protein n=1 Tax=uncultured bacterium (gcode 4) TaxID=1234023 RepID=K1YW14_9BACT|nr:MAG: hypothetical protein ACD_78C00393G0003 [uncultured bacterium (gcode 4)]
MGEGIRWSRIGEIVGWDIDGLYRRNRSIFGWGDTFLEGSHIRCEGWLVPNGRRDTSEEGRDFWTGLGESEDIIDEEEDITFLDITEVFCHRETRKGDAGTRSWCFIHLSEDHGCFVDNSGFFHLVVEIIPLTGTFSDTGDDRVSSVFWCDIMDEFLHDDGLPNSGSSKESDFPSFEHRSDEINDFDTGFEDFCLSWELSEIGSFAMNREFIVRFWCGELIDRISEDIKHTTENLWTNRDADRGFGCDNFETTLDPVSWVHSDTSDDTVTELLLDFEDEFRRSTLDFEGIVDSWDVSITELDIDNDPDNFFDNSCLHKKWIS